MDSPIGSLTNHLYYKVYGSNEYKIVVTYRKSFPKHYLILRIALKILLCGRLAAGEGDDSTCQFCSGKCNLLCKNFLFLSPFYCFTYKLFKCIPICPLLYRNKLPVNPSKKYEFNSQNLFRLEF